MKKYLKEIFIIAVIIAIVLSCVFYSGYKPKETSDKINTTTSVDTLKV